jgi:ketosteroid isomerase-like protein
VDSPNPAEALPRHVPMVRALYAAFARGDIPTLLGMLSPDVEWGEPDNPLNPAAGTRRGHDGVLEWLRIGKEAEEILVLEPRQFLVGGDTVAVAGHMKCRARATGRVYESDFVHLVTITDGRVARFQEFFDTYAAAEAYRTA